MDKTLLLNHIGKPLGKKEVIALSVPCANSISDLIELCLHANDEVAFRAAWILESIAFNYPRQFYERIPEFIEAYIKLKNRSSQRHFTKILMKLTDKRNAENFLPATRVEAIIEGTFEWMVDSETPVAVRVNCMDILYNLKDKYDWIADELAEQIQFQLKNGSAALQSRGKKNTA